MYELTFCQYSGCSNPCLGSRDDYCSDSCYYLSLGQEPPKVDIEALGERLRLEKMARSKRQSKRFGFTRTLAPGSSPRPFRQELEVAGEFMGRIGELYYSANASGKTQQLSLF